MSTTPKASASKSDLATNLPLYISLREFLAVTLSARLLDIRCEPGLIARHWNLCRHTLPKCFAVHQNIGISDRFVELFLGNIDPKSFSEHFPTIGARLLWDMGESDEPQEQNAQEAQAAKATAKAAKDAAEDPDAPESDAGLLEVYACTSPQDLLLASGTRLEQAKNKAQAAVAWLKTLAYVPQSGVVLSAHKDVCDAAIAAFGKETSWCLSLNTNERLRANSIQLKLGREIAQCFAEAVKEQKLGAEGEQSAEEAAAVATSAAGSPISVFTHKGTIDILPASVLQVSMPVGGSAKWQKTGSIMCYTPRQGDTTPLFFASNLPYGSDKVAYDCCSMIEMAGPKLDVVEYFIAQDSGEKRKQQQEICKANLKCFADETCSLVDL